MGILANSASVTHSSSSATDTKSGYVINERITLSTSPTQASYSWGMSKPSGSTARSALSDTTSATPTVVPDVAGTYVFVEGTSGFILTITVVAVEVVSVANAHRFSPITDNSVPTPAMGQTLYCSSNHGNKLALKSPDGTVQLVSDNIVTVAPIGGGADDWPRLLTLANTLAYNGAIELLPGTWTCDTPGSFPSGTTIIGSSGVTVVCTLPQASLEDAPFSVVRAFVATYQFAINNTPGTRVVRLTASPAGGVGAWLEIQCTSAHLSGSIYQIVSIASAGGGNFDVTLDRPVLYSAVAGVAVAVQVTPKRDIRVFGNGMKVVGVAQAYIEVQGGIDCQFSDMVLDASTASGAALGGVVSDTFSLRCKYSRLKIIGAGSAVSDTFGAWLIGEDHRWTDIEVSDWFTGINAADVIHQDIRGLVVYDCTNGIVVTSDGGANFTPSYATRFTGGTVYGCTTGITVTQGAEHIVFVGYTVRHNSGNGVDLADLNGAPKNIRFLASAFVNNGSNGFRDHANARGTQLVGCDVSGNAAAGLLVSGEVFAQGLVSSGGNPTATVRVLSGGRCIVEGFDLTGDAGAAPISSCEGTGRLKFCNGRVRATAGITAFIYQGTNLGEVIGTLFVFDVASAAILCTGGVVVVEDCTAEGTAVATSVGVNLGSGANARIGRRVNFDACGAGPFNHNSGAMWSRTLDGVSATTVVANGSTPVDVNFTDLKKGDVIHLTRIANGGTPGKMPLVTKTVGTKFTITADASDTSTYAYQIA